jgi:hypothetical protein
MAALTVNQIAEIRDEVGDNPPDADLQGVYDRVGTLGGTIYSVLARRLANLRANPASFMVVGEYSQSTAANIKALEDQLAKWAEFAPNQGSSLGILRLHGSRTRLPRLDPRQALDTEA